MKSYTALLKTLSKHIEQKSLISQNFWSFTETRVMGTKESNSENLSLIRSFFLDSTDIRYLKYKEIRRSGAKNF